MAIKLYDLAGKEDERRFCPHCWRVRMALAHKRLEREAVPWDEVKAWMQSWGTPNELPMPKPRKL